MLVALAAIFVAGCGGSGHDAQSESEKAADAKTLNADLAEELTALDAYNRGLRLLRGPFRAVGREFRAQQQEYVDALTRAIRGLGGETTAEPDEVDFSGVKSQADFLTLAYELEARALASYLDAAAHLFTTLPRTLAASLAAGHAEHLVLLRRGLGAGLAESAPQAFDRGEIPAGPGVPVVGSHIRSSINGTSERGGSPSQEGH